MAIVHDCVVYTTGDALSYTNNTYSAGIVNLYQGETGFILRIHVLTNTGYGSMPSIGFPLAYTKMSLSCLLPSGDEFSINDLALKEPNKIDAYLSQDYKYADIPYDSRFCSQAGTIKCIARYGTASQDNVGYARINIVVIDTTSLASNTKTFDLDISPIKPPIRIHLSQYSTDFLLNFKLFSSQFNGTWSFKASAKPFLIAKRPDGKEIEIPVTLQTMRDGSILVYDKLIVFDGKKPDAGSVLTEVAGEFDAAFYFIDKGSANPKLHKILSSTQRIHFIIEKL